jgi:hypothetical protein
MRTDMDETLVRALHRDRLPAAAPLLAATAVGPDVSEKTTKLALSTVKATDFGAGMHQRRQVRVIYRASFL